MTATNNQDAHYCIALQPIFDGQFRHLADELLYRAHGGATQADISDPLVATARVCSAAFYEIGLDALVGSRQLFLNVSCEWLARPELLPFPQEQVVIELPEVPCDDGHFGAYLKNAKEQGFSLSATSTWIHKAPEDWASLVDIARVDVRSPQAFARLDELRQGNRKLLAAFVENADSLARAQEKGFDLYQGYFYAQPQAILSSTGGSRQGNRAADMQLLRSLYSADIELTELDKLIIQDPHLCQLLFKRVNSASERRKHPISSLSQAIRLLGLDKIRALTATLLLASNEPVKRGLVFKMLVRAKMAQLLAQELPALDPDTAFTTGLFSMMEQLEGVDLKLILEESAMDTQVTKALLEHQGELGKLLKVIKAFEEASLEARSLKQVEKLNLTYLQGVAWAQEMMAMTEEK